MGLRFGFDPRCSSCDALYLACWYSQIHSSFQLRSDADSDDLTAGRGTAKTLPGMFDHHYCFRESGLWSLCRIVSDSEDLVKKVTSVCLLRIFKCLGIHCSSARLNLSPTTIWEKTLSYRLKHQVRLKPASWLAWSSFRWAEVCGLELMGEVIHHLVTACEALIYADCQYLLVRVALARCEVSCYHKLLLVVVVAYHN